MAVLDDMLHLANTLETPRYEIQSTSRDKDDLPQHSAIIASNAAEHHTSTTSYSHSAFQPVTGISSIMTAPHAYAYRKPQSTAQPPST